MYGVQWNFCAFLLARLFREYREYFERCIGRKSLLRTKTNSFFTGLIIPRLRLIYCEIFLTDPRQEIIHERRYLFFPFAERLIQLKFTVKIFITNNVYIPLPLRVFAIQKNFKKPRSRYSSNFFQHPNPIVLSCLRKRKRDLIKFKPVSV